MLTDFNLDEDFTSQNTAIAEDETKLARTLLRFW